MTTLAEELVTLSEAARIIGITRQAVNVRANKGRFMTLTKIGPYRFVSRREAELAAQEKRLKPPSLPRNLTARQLWLLGEILHAPSGVLSSRTLGYSHFVSTIRTLKAKGLVDDCHHLTAEGCRVAEIAAARNAR